MCARSSSGAHGFTLIELIGVLLLVSVLAVMVVPRMQGALSLRDDALRDEVVAALRHAHQTATSHRRLVCATVSSVAITLTIAATNPATACTAALPGPDGSASYTRNAAGTAMAVAPAGTLYFQPGGRITSDGAGTLPSSRTFAINGVADITLVGETGHVR